MTTSTKWPEHERMRAAKAALGIETLGRYLDDCMEMGIAYTVAATRPAWERLEPTSVAHLEAFFKWVEATVKSRRDELYPADAHLPVWLVGNLFERDEPLQPSERLFAAYAGIDLNKIEDERRAMLDEIRAQRAAETRGGQ